MTLEQCLQTPVSWSESGDPMRPLSAEVDGQSWVLRINDFPAEPLFTLFVDGEELGDLNEPPANWRMPM